MPVTPAKAETLRLRRESVLQFFNLHVSVLVIEQVLGIPLSDVRNDLVVLKLKRFSSSRLLTYAEKLQLFIAATERRVDGLDPNVQKRLATVLAKSLGLKRSETSARKYLAQGQVASSPVVAPHLFRTQRLLETIFKKDLTRVKDFDFLAILHENEWQEDVAPLVKDPKDLTHRVLAYFQHHVHFPPYGFAPFCGRLIATDALKAAIDSSCATLTTWQQCILNHWIPDDGDLEHSFSSIDRKLGLQEEKARHTFWCAIRRLRQLHTPRQHPSSLPPVDTTEDQEHPLLLHCDTLVLSVRLGNCLRLEGLNTLGKVCQKSEEEMLKIKNFGKKCLQELKRLLVRFNLCLDTKETEKLPEDEIERQTFQLLRRVDEFKLSTRLGHCLENQELDYLWQVCGRSKSRMLAVKNFGVATLKELKALLEPLGLTLGMTIPESVKNR